MAEVRLVDLDVIKRYSLVVRRDAVPAEELLAALESSRQTVVSAMEQGAASTESASGPRRPTRAAPAVGRTAATKRAATTRAAATRAATKRAATKRVAGRTK
jgi:hypothetical protein